MVKKVIIMGAAGRDFHNFNLLFRDNPDYRVMAFTAAQIPLVHDRIYPPELAGSLYPEGIPFYPEEELEALIRDSRADLVVFSYSDVSACGSDAQGLPGDRRGGRFPAPRRGPDHAPGRPAGDRGVRRQNRLREIPDDPENLRHLAPPGEKTGGGAPPHALRRPQTAGGAAFCLFRGFFPAPVDH